MASGRNYIGALKEYCDASQSGVQPKYTCKSTGPPHARIYTVSVLVDGFQTFQGKPCRKIKDAEHSAAEVALEELETVRLVPFGRKRSATQKHNYVGELHEYCSLQRKPWSCDEMKDIKQISGMPHCPDFVATIRVGMEKFRGMPRPNKKDAKQCAAKLALESLRSSSLSRVGEVVARVSADELERQSPTVDIELPVECMQSGLPPRSALNELCQKFCIPMEVPVVDPYSPPYVASVEVCGRMFTGRKLTKREAIDQASLNAYKWLVQSFHNEISEESTTIQVDSRGFADCVADACHNLYHLLSMNLLYPLSSTDVVAAFVLENTKRQTLQIVSLGSGSKCIRGANLSDKGHALQDCHAEVVARRAFVGYLYEELFKLANQERGSIFERTEDRGLARLKSHYKVHLYISKPPCGDATQFTRNDTGGIQHQGDSSVEHQPYWNPSSKKSRKMGILRKKIECGEGGVVLDNSDLVRRSQSWEKLKFSGIALSSDDVEYRLCTMSCSDKILKWNVVGIQGAPLSLLIQPVFLSSVVIGDSDLFHHGHIVRGICCRFSPHPKIPTAAEINHPDLHAVKTTPDVEAYTDKTTSVSLNWFKGRTEPEAVNTDTGLVTTFENLDSCDSVSKRFKRDAESALSCICKRRFFEKFLHLYRQFHGRELPHLKYSQVKCLAKGYQQKKQQLFDDFNRCNFGHWLGKPEEVDSFTLQVYSHKH